MATEKSMGTNFLQDISLQDWSEAKITFLQKSRDILQPTEFEGYYATKRAVKSTTRLEKKKIALFKTIQKYY